MIRSTETKIGDISLGEINKVKDFCNLMAAITEDVSLVSGKYVVDAKSIMGIISLDLTKPVKVIAHCDNSHSFVAFCEQYLYGEK